MIEDMHVRGLGDKAQKFHIRVIKDFTPFLGRSPDTATPDDLRAYQLHMADPGITPTTFDARIVALRFFFRDDLRARGDEALHAVRAPAAEVARGRNVSRSSRRVETASELTAVPLTWLCSSEKGAAVCRP